jgi:HSP20 family protein
MLPNRWDPFGEMQALRERVNRAFDEMVARDRAPAEPAAWAPLVDILETDDAIVLRADVAGARLQDLNIEIDGDTLTLSGERKADEGGTYLRVERPHGPLRRSFTIGAPIDQAHVKATYHNGVLEITLPKSREARPKQVKVQVE